MVIHEFSNIIHALGKEGPVEGFSNFFALLLIFNWSCEAKAVFSFAFDVYREGFALFRSLL